MAHEQMDAARLASDDVAATVAAQEVALGQPRHWSCSSGMGFSVCRSQGGAEAATWRQASGPRDKSKGVLGQADVAAVILYENFVRV
jgi:hypothetical protein